MLYIVPTMQYDHLLGYSYASCTGELLLMQAFQELQAKMVSTTQQLKISDFQIEQLKRQIAHTKLVQKEVNTLPRDIRTYEGVGRM